MDTGIKFTYVHGYKLPVGVYEIDLSDSSVWPAYSYLHIEEDGTCRLESNINDDPFDNEHDLFIDNNCDGIDVVCEKGSWRDRAKNDICPYSFQETQWKNKKTDDKYIESANSRMLKSICQIEPNFSFELPKCVDAVSENVKPQILTSIYFQTAKCDLSDAAKLELNSFVLNYQGGPIIIEGYCDYRGNTKYNYQLGVDRANAVKMYIRSMFAEKNMNPPKISIVSFGETRPTGNSLEKDRRTMVLVGQRDCIEDDSTKRAMIKRALSVIKADTYLIDASGSMRSVWDLVQTNRFSESSNVYSFNSCYLNENDYVKDGIVKYAQCITPLWDSLVVTLKKMKRGEHLFLLSDGGDNASKSNNVDDIIRLAKKRNIRISVSYLHADIHYRDIMIRIAQETGGSFYFEI